MSTLSPEAQIFEQGSKAQRNLDEAAVLDTERRVGSWHRRCDPSHVHRLVQVYERPGAPVTARCFDCDERPRVKVTV